MTDKKADELKMDALGAVTGGDLSDMGETESLKLQMAMDRRSKFAETLSNIMKSIGNTASQITGNLK